jgi:hypothetical protein
VIALLISVAHYVFFRSLDGKDISAPFMLRQSQVTTIALLLVTSFRASIIAVLGSCFTQYPWYLLRSRTLQVGLIESLFQVRSNIIELVNLRIARNALVLLAATKVSWLIPLATIYPPGALSVRSEQFVYMTVVNASIMNPPPSQKGALEWGEYRFDIASELLIDSCE